MREELESKIKQVFALALKDDRLLDEYSIVAMESPNEKGEVNLWIQQDVHSYNLWYNKDNDSVWCKYHHVANTTYHPMKIYNIRKVIALIDEIIAEEK